MVSQIPPHTKDTKTKDPKTEDPKTEDPKTDVDFFEGEAAPLPERGRFRAIAPKQLPTVIVEKLGQIMAPQGLSGPLQLLYRPILFSAIGLHALLILLPGGKGHEEGKKPAEGKEKPVTITQIATGKASPKLPTVKLPTAQLPPPKVSLPKLNLPSTAPALPTEKPKIEAAPPITPESTTTPPKEKPVKDTPAPTKDSPAPTGGGAKDNDPFAEFVHHPDAQASEDGGYRKVAGKSMADVGSFFKTALGGKKFEVTQSANEPTRQVYQVTKGGVTNVITIFTDGGDAIYVLGKEAIKDLEALKGASVIPAQFTTGIGQISSEAAAYHDFTNPALYMDLPSAAEAGDNAPEDLANPKPIVESTKIFSNKQQSEAYASLEPILKASFKTVTPAGDYGGGQLYELSTSKSKFYLNIVSRRNPATDSIVVMFSQKPN
jgi:hypothetical protein